MIVRKAKRLDVECVVRGYLAGSGWLEYQQRGSICGIPLPRGLRQADELPEPIFTPTTKAREGHDLALTLEEVKNQIGEDLGQALADASIAIYQERRPTRATAASSSPIPRWSLVFEVAT